jgi:hypothetical protein
MEIEITAERQNKGNPFHQIACHKYNPELGDKKKVICISFFKSTIAG